MKRSQHEWFQTTKPVAEVLAVGGLAVGLVVSYVHMITQRDIATLEQRVGERVTLLERGVAAQMLDLERRIMSLVLRGSRDARIDMRQQQLALPRDA